MFEKVNARESIKNLCAFLTVIVKGVENLRIFLN